MIPFSSPSGFLESLNPQNQRETGWFIFSNEHLFFPGSLPKTAPFPLKNELYVGAYAGKDLFAAEVDAQPALNCDEWFPLRALFGRLEEADFSLAGRALQLLNWDRTHQFCGCCGGKTIVQSRERCRICSACSYAAYPKVAPAIMALIRKEEKILLARSPHFPASFYSVIAGFVDPGETLEQAVEREIQEEVGLHVRNLTYFGSQPWPFTSALMIGFTCDWSCGEITPDPVEIEDAGWFSVDNLPPLPPPLSLSRFLIDSHVQTLGT